MAVNTQSGMIQVVVDGHVVEDKVYQEMVASIGNRPTNLTGRIVLGAGWANGVWGSDPSKKTNVNVFSSSLSIERMESITRGGGEECGVQGDYLSWEQMEWSLYGLAVIESVEQIQPCQKDSSMNLYWAWFQSMRHCMQHCQKMGGRVPPVRTEEEWRIVKEFIVETGILGYQLVWMSVTDEETEGVWLDYYTGENVTYTLPFTGTGPNGGKKENCAQMNTETQWIDWMCDAEGDSCVCSHTERPLLLLRGLCNTSHIDRLYIAKNKREDPRGFTYIGLTNSYIEYNWDREEWVMGYVGIDVNGTSKARKESYILGTHS